MEVDNTTDVRRGKLGLYESWGFPEVWVEVPDEPEANRPQSLRPGLTIHLRGQSGFRTAPVSSAFPGWTAEEIHRALNEVTLSDETAHVLNRVGTAMGAAQDTGPDDDPFLRRQRRESRGAGYAEGRAKGLDDGREEGMRAAVLHVFESRGIPVSASLPERLAEMEEVSAAALVHAAMECRDEQDFLRLVRRWSPVRSRKDGA